MNILNFVITFLAAGYIRSISLDFQLSQFDLSKGIYTRHMVAFSIFLKYASPCHSIYIVTNVRLSKG